MLRRGNDFMDFLPFLRITHFLQTSSVLRVMTDIHCLSFSPRLLLRPLHWLSRVSSLLTLHLGTHQLHNPMDQEPHEPILYKLSTCVCVYTHTRARVRRHAHTHTYAHAYAHAGTHTHSASENSQICVTSESGPSVCFVCFLLPFSTPCNVAESQT